jgi:hypothetical protein
VAGHPAVGVGDDLAPGQAGVRRRAALLEAAGRVGQDPQPRGVELLGEQGPDDVLLDVGAEPIEVDVAVVVGGDQHGLEGDRLAVLVADRHLRLAVRVEVGHRAALARLGEPARQAVGQPDRQRHELRRVVARVAEHQALVPRAELVIGVLVVRLARAPFECGVHPGGDVGRLLDHRDLHVAVVRLEAQAGRRVADPPDRVAHHGLEVGLGTGADLATEQDAAGEHEGLAGHAPLRVLGHDGVEHRIGDLVRDLVGVAVGDGLGGEQGAVRHRRLHQPGKCRWAEVSARP